MVRWKCVFSVRNNFTLEAASLTQCSVLRAVLKCNITTLVIRRLRGRERNYEAIMLELQHQRGTNKQTIQTTTLQPASLLSHRPLVVINIESLLLAFLWTAGTRKYAAPWEPKPGFILYTLSMNNFKHLFMCYRQ